MCKRLTILESRLRHWEFPPETADIAPLCKVTRQPGFSSHSLLQTFCLLVFWLSSQIGKADLSQTTHADLRVRTYGHNPSEDEFQTFLQIVANVRSIHWSLNVLRYLSLPLCGDKDIWELLKSPKTGDVVSGPLGDLWKFYRSHPVASTRLEMKILVNYLCIVGD